MRQAARPAGRAAILSNAQQDRRFLLVDGHISHYLVRDHGSALTAAVRFPDHWLGADGPGIVPVAPLPPTPSPQQPVSINPSLAITQHEREGMKPGSAGRLKVPELTKSQILVQSKTGTLD